MLTIENKSDEAIEVGRRWVVRWPDDSREAGPFEILDVDAQTVMVQDLRGRGWTGRAQRARPLLEWLSVSHLLDPDSWWFPTAASPGSDTG